MPRRKRTSGEQETAISTPPLFKEQTHLLDARGKTQSRGENRYQTLKKSNEGHAETSRFIKFSSSATAAALQRRALAAKLGRGAGGAINPPGCLRPALARCSQTPFQPTFNSCLRGLLPAAFPKAGAA